MAIGEPVSAVTLERAALGSRRRRNRLLQHRRRDGAGRHRRPRGRSTSAWCCRSWNRRAVQLGGGGMNGTIPNLTGGGLGRRPSLLARGFATYGSDSGHQRRSARRGAGRPAAPDDWALNDEAIAEPRLHADEEDARRRDGADRARLRRAAALQLLHRHLAGRTRGADRRAALPGRLRRRRRERADRELLVADARAGADPHPGEAARQLGHAARRSTRFAASSCGSATGSTGWPTASSTTTWRAARSST